MVSIILGAFLGFLVGLLIWFLVLIGENVPKWIIVFFVLICVVIGAWIGAQIDINANGTFIAEFETSKKLIEESIENDSLSGYERIALVEQALDLNRELTKKQYDHDRWYGVCIPDEIMKLEPICFDGGTEE